MRLDAALYVPAPPRQPRQNGRPRKKGKRLPTLEQVVTDVMPYWIAVTMAPWYGERERRVQITSNTAVWYHAGQPMVPIRWVVIRDPERRCAPQAWLATNPHLRPVQLLTYVVQRWHLEAICEDARAHLGIETQRQWSQKARARTTPVLLAFGRQGGWQQCHCATSQAEAEVVKIPRRLLERLTDALCYAA